MLKIRLPRHLLPPYPSSYPDSLEDDLLAALSDKPVKEKSRTQKAWYAFVNAIRRGINAVYYWLHYRIRRYDIVRTDLGYRYADVDFRMFLACFALLGEFVENELGRAEDGEGYRGYNLQRDDVEGQINPERKAIDLWIWYLREREGDFGDLDASGFDVDALYDRRLRELIEIRRSLWT